MKRVECKSLFKYFKRSTPVELEFGQVEKG